MKESFLGGRTIALLAVAGSLILLGTEVHAASTYFVSASNGDDSRSAQEAKSRSTPWATIQHAVDAAAAGDKVLVLPGDYIGEEGPAEAVLIQKSLKLIAKGRRGKPVTLRPSSTNTEGIVFRGTAQNPVTRVIIQGFTIEGFSRNGIWPHYAKNFKIVRNTVGDSDHVGIYPYLSSRGIVRNNVSYGGLDSALWVAGSEKIRVLANEIHSAPTGLQVTVSNDTYATRNYIYNNVIGLGVYHENASATPEGERPPKPNNGTYVSGTFSGNRIIGNNLANPVTSGLVGNLPSGIGVLIAGGDGVTLEKNMVRWNNFAGLAMIGWTLGTGDTNTTDSEPDYNRIRFNYLGQNGANPPDHPFAGLAADVINLGSGVGNCGEDNVYQTSFGPTLPPC
jgi:parallel beta-helix repeat protein